MDATVALVTLVVINMQPGLLGALSNKPLLLLSGLFSFFLIRAGRTAWLRPNVVPLIFTTFLGLLLILRVIADPDAMKNAHLTNLIATVVFALTGAIAGASVSAVGKGELAMKAYLYFIGVLALSLVVTVLLCLAYPLNGLELTRLTLRRPDIDGVGRWVVYFPFTITNAVARMSSLLLPRAVGVFREPGIFQLYVATAIVALRFVNIRHKKMWYAVLVAALLMTFSSIGYPLTVLTVVYATVVTRRRSVLLKILMVLIGLSACAALFYFEPLDYDRKLYKTQYTEHSRVTALENSFAAFADSPLIGTGLYVDLPTDLGLEGVSLLSSVHIFGLAGVLLYSSVVALFFRANHSFQSVSLLLPLLGTALLAQPLFLDPIMFFMLGLRLRHLRYPRRVVRGGDVGVRLPTPAAATSAPAQVPFQRTVGIR